MRYFPCGHLKFYTNRARLPIYLSLSMLEVSLGGKAYVSMGFSFVYEMDSKTLTSGIASQPGLTGDKR